MLKPDWLIRNASVASYFYIVTHLVRILRPIVQDPITATTASDEPSLYIFHKRIVQIFQLRAERENMTRQIIYFFDKYLWNDTVCYKATL